MNEFQQDLSEILQTTQRVLTQGELSEADIRDITAFENAVRTAALEVVSTDGLDAVAHRLTSMPGYAALNRAMDRMIADRRNNSSASADFNEMFSMLDQLIEEAKEFKSTAARNDRERALMDEFISLLTRGRQSARTDQDLERLSAAIQESAAARMLIDRGPPRREAPRPPSSSPTQSDQSPYSLQTPSTGLSDISSNSSHNVDSNQKKNTASVARQLDLATPSSSASKQSSSATSKTARSFLDRVRGVLSFSRSSSPKRMPESTTPRDESREEAYARATPGTRSEGSTLRVAIRDPTPQERLDAIDRRRLETPSTMSSLEDSRAYESAMSSGTKRGRNESQAAPPPSAAKQPRSKPPSATKPSSASSAVTPSKSTLRKKIADLKNTPAVRKWWKDNYPNINAGTIPRALNSVDMAKAWVKEQLGLKEEEHPDDSIYDV
jgi:L-rhamnose mutarotase